MNLKELFINDELDNMLNYFKEKLGGNKVKRIKCNNHDRFELTMDTEETFAIVLTADYCITTLRLSGLSNEEFEQVFHETAKEYFKSKEAHGFIIHSSKMFKLGAINKDNVKKIELFEGITEKSETILSFIKPFHSCEIRAFDTITVGRKERNDYELELDFEKERVYVNVTVVESYNQTKFLYRLVNSLETAIAAANEIQDELTKINDIETSVLKAIERDDEDYTFNKKTQEVTVFNHLYSLVFKKLYHAEKGTFYQFNEFGTRYYNGQKETKTWEELKSELLKSVRDYLKKNRLKFVTGMMDKNDPPF